MEDDGGLKYVVNQKYELPFECKQRKEPSSRDGDKMEKHHPFDAPFHSYNTES